MADVSGFTYSKILGQKVRMLNVYIGKKRAIYNKGLAEGLPSAIHRVHTKDEVGCPELLIPKHKILGPEYKVQVSNVNCFDILGKH